ncbi:MAG: PorT family protein [Bacteroidales bacterium]|nr:MAG: PorT family protein [Bacteroidales bacterium]
MIKKIALLVAVVAISTAAFAQIQFGLKGGVNMGNVKISGGGMSVDTKMLIGFQAGAFANFGINDKLSFQPEFLFQQGGCKFDEDFSDEPLKANMIAVPMMFKYSFDAFKILVGPQFAYILSAEVDGEDVTGEDELDMKKLDYGIALGAGYELENGIGFDARYYIGLANLTKAEETTAKASGIQISLYYTFK